MLYIKKVTLENVRCFEHAEISFDHSGKQMPWTMAIGDNAAGKTTLLRSIAIGLCDESSAAGLLKESDSGYIRRGADEARITIDLLNPDKRSQRRQIVTSISKQPGKAALEKLRQQTTPKTFPWDEIFICAYGAGRGTSGTGDIAGYSVVAAVYNMFNYSEGLQNPELTIRRVPPDRADVEQPRQSNVNETLARVLSVSAVRLEDRRPGTDPGVKFDASFGVDMSLRDMADGYKSTFLWVTDLLGWALDHQPDARNVGDICGIVLVDELEQHLHPQWQRTVVRSLRGQFPGIQFVTTTHSPLVAGSIGGVRKSSPDRLWHLEMSADDTYRVSVRKTTTMRGWRADQILAEPVFESVIDDDEDVELVLRRANELHVLGAERTRQQEEQYQSLLSSLSRVLLLGGQTLIERTIESERYEEITSKIRQLRAEIDQADS